MLEAAVEGMAEELEGAREETGEAEAEAAELAVKGSARKEVGEMETLLPGGDRARSESARWRAEGVG